MPATAQVVSALCSFEPKEQLPQELRRESRSVQPWTFYEERRVIKPALLFAFRAGFRLNHVNDLPLNQRVGWVGNHGRALVDPGENFDRSAEVSPQSDWN